MTYPPGGPGYPPAQPPTQFAAPTQQFAPPAEQTSAGPSKLPFYLGIAIAVCGLAVYFSSFGPIFTISNSQFPQLGGASGSTNVLNLAVVGSMLVGLIAAVGLIPKQKTLHSWVAVISLLAFLLVIAEVVTAPSEVGIGWGLYVLIVFTFLQAAIAVASLLLDAGVITLPEAKPQYQQSYGHYPPQYYGQQHGGQQQGPPQRQGYPQQQYGGYPGGPSTGGFGTAQHTPHQSGPPTPPTGFPTYGQPQPAGSSANTGPQSQGQPSPPQHGQQPSESQHAQHSSTSEQTQQTQQPASPQAGPPPS